MLSYLPTTEKKSSDPHNDATISRIAGWCFPTPVKLPAATDGVKRQNACTVIPYLQNSRSSNSRQASKNRDVYILSAGLRNFPQICKYLHLIIPFFAPPGFSWFQSHPCLPLFFIVHPARLVRILPSFCFPLSHTLACHPKILPFWHASCTIKN